MKSRIVLLLMTAGLFCGGSASSAQSPPVTEFPLPVWNNPPAEAIPAIEHRTFYSPTIDGEVGYNVLLPPGYVSGASRYPVIYHLHGRGGDENSNTRWLGPHLVEAMEAGTVQPVIVVFVNGGSNTYYVDSPDGRIRAETLFISELIPHIDATYRTITERRGRAIQGMSMGGFGALSQGMKHVELFGSIVAYAPALMDVHRLEDGTYIMERANAPPRTAEQLRRQRLRFAALFGGRPEAFAQYSPWALLADRAEQLRAQLSVRIVIGTDDQFWEANQLFHELMLSHAYDPRFVAIPGVGHNLRALFAAAGRDGIEFHARANGW